MTNGAAGDGQHRGDRNRDQHCRQRKRDCFDRRRWRQPDRRRHRKRRHRNQQCGRPLRSKRSPTQLRPDIAKASANFAGTPFGYGVYQSANGFTLGGATAVTLPQQRGGAALTILASANATGATATANANGAIRDLADRQWRNAIAVGLTNGGTININSIANANAASAQRTPTPNLFAGIVQVAYSGGPSPSISIIAASIGIDVDAAANAAMDAVANANLTYGIAQSANFAASGAVSLTNEAADRSHKCERASHRAQRSLRPMPASGARRQVESFRS